MTLAYVAAAIIGAPFVARFVFLGFGGLSAASEDRPDGLVVTDILSMRSLAFFAAFFGVTGLLLSGMGVAAGPTVAAAVAAGLGASWLNAMLVSLVRGGAAGWEVTVDMLEGRPGEVVAPIAAESEGTVAVDLDGHRVTLVARAHDGADFDTGDQVVVVTVDDGAAHVTAMDDAS